MRQAYRHPSRLGGCERDRAGQLKASCAWMFVFAALSVVLGVWACALEAWDTPTAHALIDDMRHRLTPRGVSVETRLWSAAARCDSAAVLYLVADGASVRRDQGDGRGTPLHAVAAASAWARGDCIDTAATLVRAGADPLARDAVTGRTAIEMALACDRLDPTCRFQCRRNPPLGLFLKSAVDGRRARALAASH
ncbi:Ankyrin repeat incomplete domain containing protein [Pandoravirus macleodensis]|uniref:Ankyrin repeat incomplete domain containing protein n=1 Tax=Pandoravirus macleodensis TaxID=2107707 RepID=A0A2U7UGM2_9VIRU|nr:Ankyrin repeat incomplete domain containing protein [Pandoravirus macleodensis]AVK77530.1 Ankyrin repeat incomplete domain containing protein [Pandoravirus macleodensis]